MPPAVKANYKTYEAQARLVRALVAAHPEVKWNYKEIVKCYGSDMTEHIVNHRFRTIKVAAELVKLGLQQGLDAKDLGVEDLPKTKDAIEKNNIAKYFGASTPDGMQFQFRAIKKDADAMRNGDPAEVTLTLTGTPTSGAAPTSAKAKPKTTPRASKPAQVQTPTPRGRNVKLEETEDSADAEEDYSELDSPSAGRSRVIGGRISKPSPRPLSARAAATSAARAIASAAVDLTPSESEAETPLDFPGELLTAAKPTSLFGPFKKDTAVQPDARFSQSGTDPWLGAGSFNGSEVFAVSGEMTDGEI